MCSGDVVFLNRRRYANKLLRPGERSAMHERFPCQTPEPWLHQPLPGASSVSTTAISPIQACREILIDSVRERFSSDQRAEINKSPLSAHGEDSPLKAHWKAMH